MNWPDPGTPSEHGAEEPDADAPDGPAPTPEDGDEPRLDDGAAERDLDPTSGYARLRSEVGDDLGRWEAPEPPPVTDPGEPVPGLDPARSEGPGSSPGQIDVPWGSSESSASTEVTPAADGVVRSDDVHGDRSYGEGAADGDNAPGRTHEDGLSGSETGAEASGFGRPAFSPHTGSWKATSDAPAGSDAEISSSPAEDVPTASGHAEGEQELPAPASPGGIASAGDSAPVSAVPPPDRAPFHGERDEPAASTAPGAGMFHGERPAETTPTTPAGEIPRSGSAAAIEDALSELDEGDRHATVICVANQKGGVGKTTTTVSLGAALAMLGAQVLVVDLDPQGNATTGLGLRAQEGAPSTYRVIVEQMDVEDAAEPTAVRGLHVLPSSLDLAGAEIELVPAFSRENRLKQALDAVRDLYDVILIDCPPSLGLLTINALVAADQVLVPIQCEYYALEGLGQLMRTVKLVADSLNRGLGVGGVVLTMFDGRTNLSQQVVDEVQNYFGDIAYQTIVPRTVRLSEAPSYGQPIGVFDASSRGARAYQRLAREVARRLDLELEEEVSPLDRLLGSSAPPPDEAAPLPTDLVPEDVPTHVDIDRADEEPAAEHGGPEPADGDRADHEELPEAVRDQHAGSEQHDHQDGGDQHGDHGHQDHGQHGDDGHQDHDQHGDHGDQEHVQHGDDGHQDHDQHGDHGHHDHGQDHDHGQHEGHHSQHEGHQDDHGHHEGHQDDHGQHEDHHGDGAHHEQGHEQHGHDQGHHDGHHEGHHQHDEPDHGTEGWT